MTRLFERILRELNLSDSIDSQWLQSCTEFTESQLPSHSNQSESLFRSQLLHSDLSDIVDKQKQLVVASMDIPSNNRIGDLHNGYLYPMGRMLQITDVSEIGLSVSHQLEQCQERLNAVGATKKKRRVVLDTNDDEDDHTSTPLDAGHGMSRKLLKFVLSNGFDDSPIIAMEYKPINDIRIESDLGTKV